MQCIARSGKVVQCCTVLQCVAVCGSVLQCVAVRVPGRVWRGLEVCCSVLQCVVFQCVAVCCSVLQCVAVFRSVLKFLAMSFLKMST